MGIREAFGLKTPAATTALLERARIAEDNVELLAESFADAELALEDEGWHHLTATADLQFSRDGLQRAAEVCRVATVTHPLLKRGNQVRTGYIWGQGVQVQARCGADAGQDVNAVVQAFLDDPGNRKSLTGDQAHERLERACFTDGNLFLVLFTAPRTGKVQVRTIPFDEVVDVVSNPDDRDDPWFYARHWVQQVLDQSTGTTSLVMKVAYYPALGYTPKARLKTINGAPVMWDSPVLHVKVNDLDSWTFGIGDAYAALTWARAYRDFLADWAVLVKSLSQFAWRVASKGSKARQLRQALSRRPTTTAEAPAGNPNTVGGTVNLPPDATLEAIPKSGATIDSNSGRPLAAMIAAGLGVAVTVLLADPGQTGARAVAETLDKPTELEMSMRRAVWGEVYQQILTYVVLQSVKAPQGALKGAVQKDPTTGAETFTLTGDVDPTIEVTWPGLSDTPIETLVKAIVEADSTSKLPPLEVAKLLLHALGVEDVDSLVAGMTDEQGRFIDPTVTAGQAAVDAFRAGQDPAAVV